MHRLPLRLIDDLGWANRLESVTELPAGFSGANVFRIELDSGERFAAKQLPPGVTADRLNEVHLGWQSLGKAGFTELPKLVPFAKGATFRAIDSRYWEVSSWVPGNALPTDAAANQIACGAALIGRAHAASRQVVVRHQRSPSLHQRWCRLRSISENAFPAQRASKIARAYCNDDAAFMATYSRAVMLLNVGWPSLSEHLLRSVQRMADQTQDCIYVFRDVHREHVLFDEGRTSVIDFDAMRIDSPMLDLARWVGSFDLVSSLQAKTVWESSLAAYHRENSLVDVGPYDSLIALHLATSWASLANWVDWVAEGRSFAAGIEVIQNRIDRIADSVATTIGEVF